MGLAKCPNGHIYNPRRYGKICPYCNMKTQDEAFVEKPLGFEPPVEILEETVRPVCGWMICIEGAKVGMDYKIHEGKNFVGRGDDMDVQILGDNEINRKNHTIIVYDPKNLNTMILPGDSAGIAYLNEKPVYVPTELNPYDVISLGQSRFLFCSPVREEFFLGRFEMTGGMSILLGISITYVILFFCRCLLGWNDESCCKNADSAAGIAQTTGSRQVQADVAQAWTNRAGTMAVLADGIGSANTGAVCAQIAADTILDRFEPYHELNDPVYFFQSAFWRRTDAFKKRRGNDGAAQA